MAKTSGISTNIGKTKTRRPGVHSKNNNSSNKNSKTYKKHYRGQGR